MRSQEEIIAEIEAAKQNIETYKAYLLMGVRLKDWHAVEDTGSDIRDTEARIKALEWVLNTIQDE